MGSQHIQEKEHGKKEVVVWKKKKKGRPTLCGVGFSTSRSRKSVRAHTKNKGSGVRGERERGEDASERGKR